MNVLSLFDGISCARVALDRAGIKVDKYYASEIDKYAMQVSQKNYPDIKQLGDITYMTGIDGLRVWLPYLDLLVGGSPCQDLSIAKKDRKGLDGQRSGLFWQYVKILSYAKPKYFILENVNSMSKETKQVITDTLGVESVMINAALVSAQNRKRLFWVGKRAGNKYEQVVIPQPEDRGILLRDILEDNPDIATIKSKCVRSSGIGDIVNNKTWKNIRDKPIRIGELNSGGQGDRIYSTEGKSVNLSANGGGRGAKTGLYCISSSQKKDYFIRKLTCIECERLQGLDDGYTSGISNTQRYKCLGNGFNVDVISWILSFIPRM